MADTGAQYDWQRKDYRAFELGDVLGRAFSLLRRYFFPFFLAALLIVGVPSFAAIVTMMLGIGTGASAAVSAPSWFGFAIFFVLLIVGSVLLPAAVIYAALKGWSGSPISMRQSLGVMFRRFFSLLGLGILAGLGIALGFAFLIVPGIILYCGWYVAVAVLVMEKTSVTDALSRSWELTRGYKWQVFAVVLIAVVISTLIGIVGSIPAFVLGFQSAELGVTTSEINVTFGVAQVFSSLADIIAQLISALIAASTYYELRRVKEGVGVGAIADIFG